MASRTKEVVKKCELLVFADDLKFFRKTENLSDRPALQYDLNNPATWFNTIGPEFNVKKKNNVCI